MTKLNIGCGQENWKGFVNIDIDKNSKADIFMDIRKDHLLYNDIDEIWLCHTIEHIEKKYHDFIFGQINKVLKIGGLLVVSFPNFIDCVKNWKTNYLGKREFWEATIFGRQSTSSDYHVCIMDSLMFSVYLSNYGFMVYLDREPSPGQYNCLVKATKISEIETKETVIAREVFQCQDA